MKMAYWPSMVDCLECGFVQHVGRIERDKLGPYASLTEYHSADCSRSVNAGISSRLNPPTLVMEKGEWNAR